MLTSLPLLLYGLQSALAAPSAVDPAEVIARSERTLQAANTVAGRLVILTGDRLGESRFFLEKPNLLSILSETRRDIFDGAVRTIVDVPARSYEVRPRTMFGMPYLVGFEPFLQKPAEGEAKQLLPVYSEGRVVNAGGRTVVRRRSVNGSETMAVDLDPETALPVRWSWTRADGTYEAEVRDIVLNAPIPSGSFSTNIEGMTRAESSEYAALLPVGAIAPEVAGRSLDGTAASLLEVAAKQDRTIVLFLDPTQQASADALVSAIALRKGRKLEVVSVVSDPNVARTRRFLANCRARNLTFAGPVAQAAREAFRAKLSPTTYVLDGKGLVVGSWLGYDADKVRAAL